MGYPALMEYDEFVDDPGRLPGRQAASEPMRHEHLPRASPSSRAVVEHAVSCRSSGFPSGMEDEYMERLPEVDSYDRGGPEQRQGGGRAFQNLRYGRGGPRGYGGGYG